jgi:hypothetical protein
MIIFLVSCERESFFNSLLLLVDACSKFWFAGQFFRIGWKMVMLGDETWLKLFPGLFTRHDGVSSFYVGQLCVFPDQYSLIFLCLFRPFCIPRLSHTQTLRAGAWGLFSCEGFLVQLSSSIQVPFSIQVKDTVQVDQNVSRHLENELNRDDWNLLVSCFISCQ